MSQLSHTLPIKLYAAAVRQVTAPWAVEHRSSLCDVRLAGISFWCSNYDTSISEKYLRKLNDVVINKKRQKNRIIFNFYNQKLEHAKQY